jgi:hypothetical protein
MSDDTPTMTVLDCDREAAREMYDEINRTEFSTLEEAGPKMDAISERHFAAHRSAAERAGAEAERERIMVILHRIRADQGGALARTNQTRYEHASGVLARLAIQINRDATPTPPDEPLTSEAVKAMLPATDVTEVREMGYYPCDVGWIIWKDIKGVGFILNVNNHDPSLKAIGTRSAFARLVAAFGIEVPRG